MPPLETDPVPVSSLRMEEPVTHLWAQSREVAMLRFESRIRSPGGVLSLWDIRAVILGPHLIHSLYF